MIRHWSTGKLQGSRPNGYPSPVRRRPPPTRISTVHRLSVALVAAVLLTAPSVSAQQTDPSRLTIPRIYGSGEFAAKPFGPSRWLGDGAAYTTVEPAADKVGQDLVRYDVERGTPRGARHGEAAGAGRGERPHSPSRTTPGRPTASSCSSSPIASRSGASTPGATTGSSTGPPARSASSAVPRPSRPP